MNTNDKCSYCERDQGLRVFLNRYILSKDVSDNPQISKLYDLNQERGVLQELLAGMNSNSNQENTSIILNNMPTATLNTISLSATGEDKNFYSNIYGSKSIKGFGFKGSVLRKGYLYVYMEHLGLSGWHEYEISESGFLKRINKFNFFKENSVFKNEIESKNEPCSNIVHRANALTIVIPKALEASNIYLKYSETQWSKATRENNKKNYRKNMNIFNVPAFLAGTEKQGVFPIASGIESFCVDSEGSYKESGIDDGKGSYCIDKVEYNVSKQEKDIKSALSYLSGKNLTEILDSIDPNSTSASDYMEKRNNDLTEAVTGNYSFNKLNEKKENSKPQTILNNYTDEDLKIALNDKKKMRMLFGALVTIDDPVAVAMDFGSIIAHVLSSDKTYTDLEKTVNILENFKYQIGINDDPYYTLEEIKAQMQAEELNNAYNPYGAAVAGSMEERWESGKTKEQILAREKEKKAQQQARINTEWKNNYISKINDNAFKNNLVSLKKKKIEQGNIADQLDLMGLEFISKGYLSDNFLFNFEKDNIKDCMILNECVNYILEASKIGPQMNKYMGKYIYETSDPNNYFLNSLSLNSQTLRQKTDEKINKFNLINVNNAVATQPFADLINSYSGYLAKIKSEELQHILLGNIAKSFLSVIGLQPPNNQKVHAIAPMMISMSTLSEIKSHRIEFTSLKEFQTKMRAFYTSHLNLVGEHNKIGRYVSQKEWMFLYELFKEQKYIDIPYLDVDEKNLKKLPVGLGRAIRRHAELIKEKINTPVPVIEQTQIPEKAASEYWKFFAMKVGIVGLQYWAYVTTFENPALNSTPIEKKARRSAVTIGLATSIVEALGDCLNSFSKVRAGSGVLKSLNTFIMELTTDNRAIKKGWLWRSFGLIAGLIFGGFDVYNGVKAALNGEFSYGAILAASGLFVIAGSIMMFILNPLGWIVLLAGIVLSLIAYLVQENEIQRWIRKCLLSTDQSVPRFKTIDEQMLGLKLVYPTNEK